MRHATAEPTPLPLQEHAAVRAWRLVQPGSADPERVQDVMQQPKASLYRLYGIGPCGGNVIAKRIPGHAFVERVAYESVLPQLSVSAPYCFGSVDDGDAYWLFIEDVGRGRCSTSVPAHRALASRWIASAHLCATSIPAAATLPDGGPSRYLGDLRKARTEVAQNLDNPILRPSDVTALRELIADCDAIENRWGEIEQACKGMPATLVHGDYLPKNVRVRGEGDETQVVPIDWETAGWGCPAADLAHVDLDVYRAVIADRWPHITADVLRRVSCVGRAFRWIAAVRWESDSLSFQHAERALMRLAIYRAGLTEAMQLIGRMECSSVPAVSIGSGPMIDDDLQAVRAMIAPHVPAPLLALRQEAELTRGSYRTRSLVAELSDGSSLRLFLKEFDANRYDKSDLADRWRREVGVYTTLLPHGALGVPRYYGSLAEPTARRVWLALEFVEAMLLKQVPPDQWIPAARWLARMHAHFEGRTDSLMAVPSLVRHEAEFFRGIARRAAEKLRRYDVSLAVRVERLLEPYDACVAVMTDGQRTLVHGSFRSSDILVLPGERVCPVDWERAAIGCRFLDLAYLTDLLPEASRLDLLRVYLEEVESTGRRINASEVQRAFDCCTLHRTFARLRKWARQRDVTPAQLVERAEHLIARCATGGR